MGISVVVVEGEAEVKSNGAGVGAKSAAGAGGVWRLFDGSSRLANRGGAFLGFAMSSSRSSSKESLAGVVEVVVDGCSVGRISWGTRAAIGAAGLEGSMGRAGSAWLADGPVAFATAGALTDAAMCSPCWIELE